MAEDDLTERARELRKNMTDAEQTLWTHLRAQRLADVKFRRQQPLGDFIVDFVSFDQEVIIEVDGGQHVAEKDYDEARTRKLEEEGFTVIRFWNDDVLRETEKVLEEIKRHLD
jgi:very-short-patch-repair endonuclease